MTRKRILLLLAFVGSAVCWWPAIIEPSLEFPRWLLLPLVAFISGVSILLCNGRWWLAFVAAAAVGSFAGLLSGVILWPWSDGIARSYALIAVAIGTATATAAALICSLAAFLAVRRWPLSNRVARGAAWVLLGLCLAFGPTLLALTKPLVKRRVAHNESSAALRFASLQNALQRTRAETGAADSICDGQSIQKHYVGPPFTREDWRRILGNFVEEDEYMYGITCLPNGTYRLEVRPKMPKAYGYGDRIFCADESGEVPCDLKWNR